jgi:putative membrane protein
MGKSSPVRARLGKMGGCYISAFPLSLVQEPLLRWVITGLARFVSGLARIGHPHGRSGVERVRTAAIVLGLVNAVIRPMLKLLSCPLIILTLGFFVLVIK